MVAQRARQIEARALATEPRVLLLDEVAGGLVEHETAALVSLVKHVRASGVSIIWIEHVVHALIAAVDRLVVLHGGTGLTDDDFRRFIANGVAKVNLSTTLKLAYMRAAQAHVAEAEAKGKWEPVKMFDDITAAVKATVREHMDQLGSTGKAAGVSA